MMEYVPRFNFTFSPNLFKKTQNKAPSFSFTCAELAKSTLPPYLQLCMKFLDFLLAQKDLIKPFEIPVPDDPLIAENYYVIIKHPMDISTCREKVIQGKYEDLNAFKNDIDLIWSNCLTYNGKNSVLGMIGTKLKCLFDDAWDLHTNINDESTAISAIDHLVQAQKLCDDMVNNELTIFRGAIHPKLKNSQSEKSSKTFRIDRDRDDQPSYSPPTEQMIRTPMITNDKYDLAVNIDTLPPELLGKVIDILIATVGFTRNDSVEIPFANLDNKTLREIEAYVKFAKERETNVRRYYQSETIPAEKQLEVLNEELNKIQTRIQQKRPSNTSSSGFTSEAETTTDSEMSGDSSTESDSYDES